jgi:hypothetical protein
MLWKSDPNKIEKLTPWVIGAFAIVLFAVATYMNYGNSLHWGSATDVSATSTPKDAQ